MQLTYRGQTYTSAQPATTRLTSVAAPLLQTLKYRGNTYTR